MKPRSRLFKAHAQAVADKLVSQGWALRHEFRTKEDEEPYEFILEWTHEEEPPAIDSTKFAPPVVKKVEPNQPLKRNASTGPLRISSRQIGSADQ